VEKNKRGSEQAAPDLRGGAVEGHIVDDGADDSPRRMNSRMVSLMSA
jgi:hypothetical protein